MNKNNSCSYNKSNKSKDKKEQNFNKKRDLVTTRVTKAKTHKRAKLQQEQEL
jgi:hypothetical protein